MFGQTFEAHDLVIIGLLVVLEGVLSIDNALVLGLLAKRLPKHQQQKALTYGLVGALVFRVFAIATAAFLLKWTVFKLLGGGYLIWVAMKHFFFTSPDEEKEHIKLDSSGHPILVDDATGHALSAEESEEKLQSRAPSLPVGGKAIKKAVGTFWSTVFVIEMTDIAFAIDSIVAAIGVVGPAPAGLPAGASHPKLWVIILGGFLGVVLMRFAAVLFIKLLDRFPRFETAAYLLVIVIGMKLCVDWAFNSEAHPHRVNFHNIRAPEFWVFWAAMIVSFAIGFIPGRKDAPKPA